MSRRSERDDDRSEATVGISEVVDVEERMELGAGSLGPGEVGRKWEDPRGVGAADGNSRGPRSDDGRHRRQWVCCAFGVHIVSCISIMP